MTQIARSMVLFQQVVYYCFLIVAYWDPNKTRLMSRGDHALSWFWCSGTRSTNVGAVSLRCVSCKMHQKWELIGLCICGVFWNALQMTLVERVPVLLFYALKESSVSRIKVKCELKAQQNSCFLFYRYSFSPWRKTVRCTMVNSDRPHMWSR